MTILLAIFQATIIFELLFFLLLYYPDVVKYTPPQVTTATAAAVRIDAVTQSPFIPMESCSVQAGCGVCSNMSPEGGTIESPNYPAYYGEGLNCQFNISGPTESIIQLTFTDFNVDTCCDFLSVFDGTITNPVVVGLNGKSLPSAVNITKTVAIIVFTSNIPGTAAPLSEFSAAPTTANSVLTVTQLPTYRWKANYQFLPN